MLKRVKRGLFWVLTVLNVIAIAGMIVVGYSDRVDPMEHPLWSALSLGFGIIVLVNLAFLVVWTVVRLRMVWLPIVGFLLCYGPVRTFCPINIQEDPPHRALKVLSYNVYYFNPWDLWVGDTDKIVEYIINSNSDIACLQEAKVDMASWKHIYADLARKYKYTDTITVNHDMLMVLSQYPIKHREVIPIISEGNSSVAYTLNIDGKDVLLVNNHLESYHLSSDDKNQFTSIVDGKVASHQAASESKHLVGKLCEAVRRRAPQADMVHEFIERHREKGMPVIVCGDFNDVPNSYSRRKVAEGLRDAYVESGLGPGVSYHEHGMLFRIDHIMCSDDFVPYRAKVDNSIGQSDHYPIYCWLDYRPKP